MIERSAKAVAIQLFIFDAIKNLFNFCNEKKDEEIYPDGPSGVEYLDGLVRIDKAGNHRGSYVEGVNTLQLTYEYLWGKVWNEFFPEEGAREGCRYFQTDLSEMPYSKTAKIGVMSLRSCRDQDLSVNMRKGKHGYELIHLASSADKSLIDTNIITLIVEGEMMSTWHPGPVFTEIPKDPSTDPSDWDNSWPVKLV